MKKKLLIIISIVVLVLITLYFVGITTGLTSRITPYIKLIVTPPPIINSGTTGSTDGGTSTTDAGTTTTNTGTSGSSDAGVPPGGVAK